MFNDHFVLCILCSFFFFFKQKTAYEMRISDWSSDVCSSDLLDRPRGRHPHLRSLDPPAAAEFEPFLVDVQAPVAKARLRPVLGLAHRRRIGEPRTEDRKSTRLNSSH